MEVKIMSCADCDYRQQELCVLFDDVILSYADSCFMDTDKDDFNFIENDSCISRNDR